MIAAAIVGLVAMASMVTSAPFSDNRPRIARIAAHSFSLASTASCASTRRWVEAQAETRCSGGRPVALSPLRRSVLPSSATRSAASSRSEMAQAVKQASNSAGSIRFSTTRSQSSLGTPK